MGIHYTYGANKNAKLMEKKAKREKKLAEKRAKTRRKFLLNQIFKKIICKNIKKCCTNR